MNIQKAILLKGISPGTYIAHQLQKKEISQLALAKHIDIHPQTLNAIIKGKRKIPLSLGVKIEQFFAWEEGSLMLLQLFCEIKKTKENSMNKPNLSIFRPVLFWDTKLENINWHKNKKAVIKRVFNRGNLLEKKAIIDFYKLEKTNIKTIINE